MLRFYKINLVLVNSLPQKYLTHLKYPSFLSRDSEEPVKGRITPSTLLMLNGLPGISHRRVNNATKTFHRNNFTSHFLAP